MARTPSSTARTFQHKAPDPRTLTSERIADHLRDFESSGGRIEVLGVTRVLTKVDETATLPKPAPAR
jgi:hypothetical protein